VRTHTHTSRRVLRALAVAFLPLVLSLSGACASRASTGQRVSHKGVGIVVAIAPEKSRIKIDHEAIEGYMEAMTMWFSVKDKSMLDGIASNDKVEFTVTEEDSADVITELKKAQ
jgi:Cu/Ag efflux protein CusF